ncbi:MAG: IS30 family transposase [Patescibacteria group bacterium]
MKSFKHLSLRERESISKYLSQGFSCNEIGSLIGRSGSTVSRDIIKNKMTKETYWAIDADFHYDCRAEIPKRPKKIENNLLLKEYINSKIKLDWSPQQIANRLKEAYPLDMSMRVSHETIYTYLYCLPRGTLRKELMSHLRKERAERQKRGTVHKMRRMIPDMVSISERPKEVADRTVPGHWEGDLIVGKGHKSAIGTLVERTTRTVILVPLKAKDAFSVRKAFEKEIKKLPRQMKQSLTYDRGMEMFEHKLFTEHTKMQVYFADPYSPWQRGTNENTNGLLRQYFPKGTDLSLISRQEIKRVQRQLNGRPRKVLGYRTPYESFNSLITDALAI